MAFNTQDLKVRITIDAKGVGKNVDVVTEKIEDLGEAAEDSALKTKRLSKAIAQAEKEAASQASAFSRLQAGVISINQALELGTRIYGRMASAIGGASRAAAELEKGVAEIRTLVTDGSDANVDFANSVLLIQKQFGGSQRDIIKAFYDALSAGATDAANSLQFIEGVSRLAVGGVASLGDTVSLVTGILENYSISVDNIGYVTDILFKTVQKGKTTIPELATQFGEVAATAASAGVSFEELSASFATATIAIGNTSRAATSIRSAIVALLRPTEDMQKVYDQLGITSIETTLAQDGLGKTLKRISDTVGGSQEAIVKLFGAIESLAAVSAIAGSGAETFVDALADIKEAASSGGDVTETAFRKIADTGAFRMEQLRASFDVSVTKIGAVINSMLVPVLESIAPIMARVANAFVSFASYVQQIDFDKISTTILFLAQAIGVKLVASLFVANSAFLKLAISATSAATAFVAAFAPVFASVGIFVAIGAAVEVIVRNIKNLGDVATVVFRSIAITLTELRIKLTEAKLSFQELFSFDDAASKTRKQLVGVLQDMQKMIAERDEALGKIDTGLTGAIVGSIKSLFDGFSSESNSLKSELSKTAAETEKAFKKTGASLIDLSDNTKDAVSNLKSLQSELERVAESTQSVLLSLATEDLSRVDQARIGVALERERLAELERQLMAAGNLTDADRDRLASIRQQLDIIESLRVARAPIASDDDLRIMQEIAKTAEEIEQKNREAGKSQFEIQQMALQAQLDQLDAVRDRLQLELKSAENAERQLAIAKQIDQLAAQEIIIKQQIEQPAEAASAGGFLPAGDALGSMLGDGLMSVLGPQLMKMFTSFTNIIGLILQAPALINALTSFIDQIAEFPIKLMEAVVGFVKSIGTFIPRLIEGLMQAIPEIVLSLISLFYEVLPNLVNQGVEMGIKFTQEILNRLPEIITKFIVGFITAIPRVVVGFIRGIVVAIPEIIKGIIQAVPVLIDAIISGIGQALGMVGDMFSNIFDFGGVEEGFSDIGDSIATSSSELFSLIDGNAEARGLDISDRIAKAVDGSTNRLASIWERLMAALRAVWDFIEKYVWDPMVATLEATWMVIKAIWDAMMSVLSATWDFVKSTWDIMVGFLRSVWDEMMNLLSGVWDGIKSIWDGMMTILSALWDGVKLMWDTFIVKPLKAIWDFVKTLFDDPIAAFKGLWADIKSIFTSFLDGLSGIWEKLKSGFASITEGLGKIASSLWDFAKNIAATFVEAAGKLWEKTKELFGKLGDIMASAAGRLWDKTKEFFGGIGQVVVDSINGALSKAGNFLSRVFSFEGGGRGTVENFLGFDFPWFAFAEGGVVPGVPKRQGDHAANDTVPALLSPGEIVIPRSMTQDKAFMAVLDAKFNGRDVPQFSLGGALKAIGRGDFQGAKKEAEKTSVGQVVVKVGDTATNAVNTLADAFKRIGDTAKRVYEFIQSIGGNMPSLTDLINDPVGSLKRAFQPVADDFFRPVVLGALQRNARFAEGGYVGGYGTGDTVPALLTPGEFVMNRQAVSSIGVGQLSAMNKGASGAGSTIINIDLTVNSTEKVDMRRLMTDLKSELRKESLRGSFIIAQNGIRG